MKDFDLICQLSCVGGLASVFVAILAFFIYRFVTFSARDVRLGARIEREPLTFRASWSGLAETDVSVVRTSHRTAPIAIVLVQRTATSRQGIGASVTREQAQALARWLREAAGGAYR